MSFLLRHLVRQQDSRSLNEYCACLFPFKGILFWYSFLVVAITPYSYRRHVGQWCPRTMPRKNVTIINESAICNCTEKLQASISIRQVPLYNQTSHNWAHCVAPTQVTMPRRLPSFSQEKNVIFSSVANIYPRPPHFTDDRWVRSTTLVMHIVWLQRQSQL